MSLVTTCDACGIFEVELHHDDARDKGWPYLCDRCCLDLAECNKRLEERNKNVEDEFRSKR